MYIPYLGYAPCNSRGMYFTTSELQGAYPRYGIQFAVCSIKSLTICCHFFQTQSAKSAWYSQQVHFSVSNNVHENLLLPTVQPLNSMHRRNRGIHLQCSHVTGC